LVIVSSAAGSKHEPRRGCIPELDGQLVANIAKQLSNSKVQTTVVGVYKFSFSFV
jgi:hypothetical protein